jgi:hypothetical protein
MLLLRNLGIVRIVDIWSNAHRLLESTEMKSRRAQCPLTVFLDVKKPVTYFFKIFRSAPGSTAFKTTIQGKKEEMYSSRGAWNLLEQDHVNVQRDIGVPSRIWRTDFPDVKVKKNSGGFFAFFFPRNFARQFEPTPGTRSCECPPGY